jgi:hypothetical protein
VSYGVGTDTTSFGSGLGGARTLCASYVLCLRAPLDGSASTTTFTGAVATSTVPIIHQDPRHTHPMVTRQAVGVLRLAIVFATKGDPRISLIPSFVREALADPH